MSPKSSKHRLEKVPTSSEPALIRFQQGDGEWVTVTPRDIWDLDLSSGLPARKIPKYFGQQNTPGNYYSTTDDRLLMFESHLESKWMMLYDFDETVVSISPQPFHLTGLDEDDSWDHYPDLLIKRTSGRCDVVDVKNPLKLNDPKVVQQARRTKVVCDAMGFGFALHGEPDPVYMANVAWLAGYRRTFPFPEDLATELFTRAQAPVGIRELVDGTDFPPLARAVVFHLMWHHELIADLNTYLSDVTTVQAADQVRGKGVASHTS